MRETSHTVFQVEAGRAESGEICSDFLGDGLWRPHVERSLRPNLTQKGFPGRDGESPGLADATDDLSVARPELFPGPFVGDGDVTRRVHADRQRGPPKALQGLLEELGERRETGRFSADDREHQRESVVCGADDRLRASADADPGRERPGFGVWHDILVVLVRHAQTDGFVDAKLNPDATASLVIATLTGLFMVPVANSASDRVDKALRQLESLIGLK